MSNPSAEEPAACRPPRATPARPRQGDPAADDGTEEVAAASMLARVRALMVIAGATTLLAIAAVLGVIGYRLFRAEGTLRPVEATALLPKGARIVATSLAEERLMVTIEVAGTIEIRTFDARTLKPTGRLRFATEP